MTYSWEWLSDLRLIPAWEILLAGVIIGMLITLVIVASTEGKK